MLKLTKGGVHIWVIENVDQDVEEKNLKLTERSAVAYVSKILHDPSPGRVTALPGPTTLVVVTGARVAVGTRPGFFIMRGQRSFKHT